MENRDGLRRRRPSDEFSHFELDQKRTEYKLKKAPLLLTQSKTRLNSDKFMMAAKVAALTRSTLNAGLQGDMAIE